MVEVRTKDKIFVSLLVPAALAAALVYFVRVPAVKARDALRAERARLPDEQMFPLEKRQLMTRLDEAKKELAALRAEKPAAVCVKGEPTASAAARQDAVLAVLTDAGARIVRAEPVRENGQDAGTEEQSASRGAATLQATGIRPVPEAVRVVAEATYPQLADALRRIAAEKMAVVPEAVSLTAEKGGCRWELTLWL